MAKFITEDDIEKSIIEKLESSEYGYNKIVCDSSPEKQEDLNDGTFRRDKHDCILPEVLKSSLYRINSNISKEKIDLVIDKLSSDFSDADLLMKNYELYNNIRNSIKVETTNNDGVTVFDFIKLIDFDNPQNNDFTVVSQMWIQGRYYWRRPDLIIFINGLPLVFIELKNSVVKVKEAYDDNLTNYKKDIPNLFAFNQICVLSNGLETRLGAFNSPYEYFFEWLKNSEDDIIDRDKIHEEGLSVNYLISGLLKKEVLLDYIENFIMFDNQKYKIIAKNHQFLGVNNLVESVKNREELQGKLGVFWHTQGSGKSYSMVFFTRKVRKKIKGNFSFLIITDRQELDTQIHKTFVRTEVIGKKEECQPKDSSQLREYLTTNKGFIFTLIHKFRYDKDKEFPVLTTRNDIIVLVDEAHRTQYKDLAENMRKALPNANFVAFTGTPLLGSKKLTNQWFGKCVSEYNFKESVDDQSTVPLFYSKRVPDVELENNYLDDDILDIIEEENLNSDEERILENSTSRVLEVIKRDSRIDTVARDIAYHFPRRGFLGKGLVVSVDKYTTVKMYDKVQHNWNEEKQKITQERNVAKTQEERDNLTRILDYMNNVEMAVVISEEANEVEKFREKGLDITIHRQKMNEITVDGKDLEDRFKDPNDKLQLVFVCSMWLTGFDVPNLSTLYLDKPMKSHTLMQAIARANRVYPEKNCGIIVDYVNIFKFMKQALSEYATGDDGSVMPAKDVDKLISLLDSSVQEAYNYLNSLNIDIDSIIEESSTLDKLEELRKAYNTIIDNDENKEKFKIISNTMVGLYDAAKPEVFEKHWKNERFSAIDYLHGLLCNKIDDEKIKNARLKMEQVLDNSIVSSSNANETNGYAIYNNKVIDLSKIDTENLKKELKESPYRAVEIDDLKKYLEKALEQMINKNMTRQKFSERFKNVVDRYNSGNSTNEDYYNQLVDLVNSLKEEQNRANLEGLTEEELELYDLLVKDKKLTKEEEQKVKLAAKNLFEKLTKERDELLVVDWYKDMNTMLKVKNAIALSLNEDLPESYDKPLFENIIIMLLMHFIDMAVNSYGWISNKSNG